MSDTQYEVIKATFPDWAAIVKNMARSLVDHPNDGYYHGMLVGLGSALMLTKQCSDAPEFVEETIKKVMNENGGVA